MKRLFLAALAALCFAGPALAAAPVTTVCTARDAGGNVILCTPVISLLEDGTINSGGGGGGGAVTAASGAYALGSIIDLGTGASPGANTVNGRLSGINTTLGTPFQTGGSIGNTGFISTGNVASAATDSGNPVKIGCVFNSTPPTYTTGQRADCQVGARGSLSVQLMSAGGATALAFNTTAGTDAATNTLTTVPMAAYASFYNGTTWDRARGDTAGLVTQPHALTASRWNYAAASGGISNTTTAVTIAAAAGGSLRNYITGIQITSDALGAATEIAVRDGAAGTVIWRMKIGTGGLTGGLDAVFPVPLKGSANTLLEVVTLTASITGSVYFNAQGFTAP